MEALESLENFSAQSPGHSVVKNNLHKDKEKHGKGSFSLRITFRLLWTNGTEGEKPSWVAWPNQSTAVRSPAGQVQAGLLQVLLQVVFGMGILSFSVGKQERALLVEDPFCGWLVRIKVRWDGSKSCFFEPPSLQNPPAGHLAGLGDGNTAPLPAGSGIWDKSLLPCPPGQRH